MSNLPKDLLIAQLVVGSAALILYPDRFNETVERIQHYLKVYQTTIPPRHHVRDDVPDYEDDDL